MSDAPKLLLDLQELADALGVHLSQIYRWRDRGELPVPILHLGRSARVRTVDVEAWLARLAEDSTDEHHNGHQAQPTRRGSSRGS